MLKLTTKIAAAALTAAILAAGAPVQASGKQSMLKACLDDAKNASNPKAARNHCFWSHWEKSASSN